MTFRRTTCPHCRKKLEPGWRIHPGCIDGYAEAQAAKAERARAKAARMAAKVERAETRQRKAEMKTIPQLIKEAQVAFNTFIRARDEKEPCICCGKPLGDARFGGGFDAGHYRSTGSASHLRFNEDNCHAQRKHCNQYGAGRAVDYRIGLVARIGIARVEALETDNAVHKWTREELISIRAHYIQRRKELLKEMA